MAQSMLSVRMDGETKAAFAAFCEEAGMSVSTAVNLFARQTLREGRIPFSIDLHAGKSRTETAPTAEARDASALSVARIATVVSRAARTFPGISRVILFGSRARGDARPASDIDLRVEYDPEHLSLFELGNFSDTVREATGVDVDIVSAQDLGGTSLADAIEREGVVLYERS